MHLCVIMLSLLHLLDMPLLHACGFCARRYRKEKLATSGEIELAQGSLCRRRKLHVYGSNLGGFESEKTASSLPRPPFLLVNSARTYFVVNNVNIAM